LEPLIQVRILAPEPAWLKLFFMPELPEVETIRRGLEPCLRGRVLLCVDVTDRKILHPSAEQGLRSLVGQTIQTVWRRAKYLVVDLSFHHLVFHLGMTGQLTLRDPARPDSTGFKRTVTGLQYCDQHPPDRHTHLSATLSDGRQLLFRDVRKFGRVYVVERNAENLQQFFAARRLGLEPFTDQYNLGEFLARFRGRKLRVKSLLLNQNFVAGVGNIYADEALFEAELHPARRVSRLSRAEKERLFEAVQAVLTRGIEAGGTTFRDFVNSSGEKGGNQEKLRVYGREGKPCLRCATVIVRTLISQRGTHFCPKCQLA
jgi:formamidopyrimidine-DNA glycosylase